MRHIEPFSPKHPMILDSLGARSDWTEFFGRDPFDCPHPTFGWMQKVATHPRGHHIIRRYCGDCKTPLGQHEEAINDTRLRV